MTLDDRSLREHLDRRAVPVREQLAQGKLVAANGNRSVTLQNESPPGASGSASGGHWIVVTGMTAEASSMTTDTVVTPRHPSRRRARSAVLTRSAFPLDCPIVLRQYDKHLPTARGQRRGHAHRSARSERTRSDRPADPAAAPAPRRATWWR